jgi:hypothetical protein
MVTLSLSTKKKIFNRDFLMSLSGIYMNYLHSRFHHLIKTWSYINNAIHYPYKYFDWRHSNRWYEHYMRQRDSVLQISHSILQYSHNYVARPQELKQQPIYFNILLQHPSAIQDHSAWNVWMNNNISFHFDIYLLS